MKIYTRKDWVIFTSDDYWSSYQHNFSDAWIQDFTDGAQALKPKDFDYYSVRAVRAF